MGLLPLTEAMLESHIEAGRQHNSRYAGFHPSEKALDIPVFQQMMEQRRDQEDDQERRQDNGGRGGDGSQESTLAAPHISRQIDHDRSRCTFTDGNHQESSSATTSSSSSEGNSSEVPSTPEISNRSDISISDSTADSPSATPDVISSSTSSSDSNESPSDTQVSPDPYTLTRYDSIYDVPYAKLDYKSYVEEDGDSGHYTLTKDGIPWVGTPGTDQFGDICFSDGRNLHIQCFLSYNDTLSTDFRWFCVNFNHFDDEDSHFLPDETMNKLFTGADGETLYTDDGYQYKLSTMPWCQDGTCKR